MGEKSPSFQLYPRDLLADTDNLSDAAFGLYVRLLCKQWLHGSLPAALESDDGSESMIDILPRDNIKERRRSFVAFAKLFKPHPVLEGQIVQPRLERVRAKQVENRSKFVDSGVDGSNKRWAGHREAMATLVRDAAATEAGPNGVPHGDAIANALPHPIGSDSSRGRAPAVAAANADVEQDLDRARSPILIFGSWYLAEGITLGAIAPHYAAQPGAVGYAYKHSVDIAALLEAYGEDECKTRALRFFRRCSMPGRHRLRMEPTPARLAEHWTWFVDDSLPEVRGAVKPYDQTDISGGSDYAAIMAERAAKC